MKFLLTALIVASAFVQGWSITCYRCGGTEPSCKTSGSATVECEDSSIPNAVFACQVYTVNYTSYDTITEFKSCCLYEDCNKDPCQQFGKDTVVCSKMASCQADKCNFDYASAKASQRPTLPSKASSVAMGTGLVMTLGVAFILSLFI